MFIVIDWIDWSGKGTQIEIVAKELEQRWKTVKVLDFPRYWEKSAFMVEKYLNGEYGKNVSAKQASIFYAIDRFQSYQEGKQDFTKYDYILSNRYVSANMIHQAWKISDENERKVFLEWISDLEYNILGIPKPDKTIFLNVSPDMSQKLVLKKAEREYLKWGKKMDLHEEDKDHLIHAHASAISIVKQNSDWIKIDCEFDNEMKSIDEITNNILNEII
jgi:thymidylate kinase